MITEVFCLFLKYHFEFIDLNIFNVFQLITVIFFTGAQSVLTLTNESLKGGLLSPFAMTLAPLVCGIKW